MEAIEDGERYHQCHRSYSNPYYGYAAYDIYGVRALLREEVASSYEKFVFHYKRFFLYLQEHSYKSLIDHLRYIDNQILRFLLHFYYLASQLSGFSFAVSLRNWNCRM